MSEFREVQIILLPHNNISTTITKYLENDTLSINLDILAPHTNQHLYIISDDEIKDNDWFVDKNCSLPISAGYNIGFSENKKKIIATTDTSLEIVSKGINPVYEKLPQPSQQFITKYIEEYNKGNIITDVLVEYEKINIGSYINVVKRNFIEVLKVNPKDNTINVKLEEKHTYSKEQLIKAMIWAENNGKHYVGTDKEGQLKQFNEYVNKL